jgi:thiamine-monophosphate kinase
MPAFARARSSMTTTIGDVGERELIARLGRRVGTPPPAVVLGIGDDAAVLAPPRNRLTVLTTDSLVEDVHFRRAWTPPGAIGHKALAVNLSDLAAMGAQPTAALLSLAMPVDFPLADFDALLDAFATLASKTGAALVGGNLTRSPGPLVVDVTAVGEVRSRRVLTRSGGRPGDELYVTGAIGAAAAGLAWLGAGVDRTRLDAAAVECVARYERPEARLTAGVQVGRNRAASACVDLSDGLADAAGQIAQASGTGVLLEAAAVPIHRGMREWAKHAGRDALSVALAGGEDYELLFAVPRRRRRAFLAVAARCRGLAFTRVGQLSAEPGGAWVVDANGGREPLGSGFSHF